MIGQRLGSYEITGKIGEGGMGEVWVAHDVRLNRSVAVKVLPESVVGDASRRQRFEQEARALAAVNHPNIVGVYDSGEADGRAYIVSELVNGESLRTVIARGCIGGRKLIDLATQIAEGIAAAHAIGIIHRDLKPENIMITAEGRVKILDFGLAKQQPAKAAAAADATATLALSEPGIVLGTVGYMSPEQVRGEPADSRSDIFSFGCVLYEMASGKRAFTGGSSVEVMSAILREEPQDLLQAEPSAPPPVETIVRRCLEKRPENRFQSSADLAFALRALSTATSTRPAPAIPDRPKARRWRPWAFASAAAVGLFAAGYALRSATTVAPAMPSFQRLTFMQGSVSSARFTHDGQSVVYAASWDGKPRRVFLAIPGNAESRDLQMPDRAAVASLSGKGDLALIGAPFERDGTGTLMKASISGGLMRPLLTGVRAADWAPDGENLAVVRAGNGKWRLEYPVGKVIWEHAYPPMKIRVSPDGNWIAFTHYHEGSSIGLSIIDRAGKSRFLGSVSGQTATEDSAPLCWTADGREIWFRSYDTKNWGTLYAMNLNGKVRTLARFPGRVTLYDIARDGRLLMTTEAGRIGIYGGKDGQASEVDLSVLEVALLKGLTPDGSTVLMDIIGESGGANGSIYVRRTDASPAVRIGDGVAFGISPDAKWIFGYTAKAGDARRYLLMPTGAGEERDFSVKGLERGRGLIVGWLPHPGQYVVLGNMEGKKWQGFLYDSEKQNLRAITPEGLPDAFPMLSPSGKYLLALGPDRAWTVYPLDGGPERRVAGLTPEDSVVSWRSDEASVFVSRRDEDLRSLEVSTLQIASGQRALMKKITPARPVDSVDGLRITADGKTYAYNYQLSQTDLYVVSGLQ